MNQSRRFALFVGSLLLSGLLLWPPVFAAIEARRAADYYRSQFAASRPMTIVLTEFEWALRFGGHAGLRQLRVLSEDQTLKPSGRRMASDLCEYIERGKHLPDLREWLAATDLSDFAEAPFEDEYLRYIYLHDLLAARKP